MTMTATLGDRSLFPDLQARAYLNHCAISPPSLPVRDAVRVLLDDYATRGAFAFTRWRDGREELRARLARLVGAAPEDVAFIPNTTRGVVDIALCFPWEPGDRVLVLEGEFPTNVTPWQRAAELFGLELRSIPVGAFASRDGSGLSRLADELKRGLRLIAVSAVQFQTGLRMPLDAMARLCHDHGAEVFVDAIQAVGCLPVDVGRGEPWGVDYLCAGSHKWLMGTEGAGFLYIAPDRVGALRPNVAGWLSHEEPFGFLFEGAGHLRYDRPIRKRADLVESGAPNSAGLAALGASVTLIEALGPAAIFAHVSRYLDALEQGLLARGFTSLRDPDPALRSGILGVLPADGATVAALWKALAARGIACSMPDGILRFGPHWPNALAEVPLVLGALDDATS